MWRVEQKEPEPASPGPSEGCPAGPAAQHWGCRATPAPSHHQQREQTGLPSSAARPVRRGDWGLAPSPWTDGGIVSTLHGPLWAPGEAPFASAASLARGLKKTWTDDVDGTACARLRAERLAATAAARIQTRARNRPQISGAGDAVLQAAARQPLGSRIRTGLAARI